MEEDQNSQLGVPFPIDDVASVSDYGAQFEEGDIKDIDASPQDKCDIYDLELVLLPNKVEIDARHRLASGGRPTYKIQKTLHSHLFGKKNMDVVVNRNEAWDANKAEPLPKQKKVLGYCPIFRGYDQSSRTISIQATPNTVISATSQGGRITLMPFCGNFDPQRSRTPHIRDSTFHHFFNLNLTDSGNPDNGKKKHVPIAQHSDAPYIGGGSFVFDCASNGDKDLLTTLYCTRYDSRHKVRKGDIVLAQLRLHTPVIEPTKGNIPAWKRLFRERHASLHISRRGMDECFTGENVQLLVPNPVPGKRYFLTPGQTHELILSAVSMALLSIEHDGIESKKWNWMIGREVIERRPLKPTTIHAQRQMLSPDGELREKDSVEFHTAFDHPGIIHAERVPGSYAPSMNSTFTPPMSRDSSVVFSDGYHHPDGRSVFHRQIGDADSILSSHKSQESRITASHQPSFSLSPKSSFALSPTNESEEQYPLPAVYPVSPAEPVHTTPARQSSFSFMHKNGSYPMTPASESSFEDRVMPLTSDELEKRALVYSSGVDVTRNSPLDELQHIQA